MHRYSVDNTNCYSADDLVLFRESPFASWMERLTLENPGHGIPPDPGSAPPHCSYRPQNAFAATLRASGRQFVQIGWDLEERKRRSATLEAMRSGANFIVDGHLAVGPLAGPVNLLMRTSGFSEWGDYLYLPCDTQGDLSSNGPFKLCFIADLLHSLQGQLPPQMLVIRRESDLVALQTDDHIHYYRAVKQRFMLAQRDFRKHRMPDPAESSHCGRWYDCANEVIRQRPAQRQSPVEEDPGEEGPGDAPAAPGQAVRGSAGSPADRYPTRPLTAGSPERAAYDLDAVAPRVNGSAMERPRGGTLAEQASALAGRRDAAARSDRDPSSGPGLQPLRYIGESLRPPELLGDFRINGEVPRRTLASADVASRSAAPAQPAPHPLDSPGFNISGHVRPGGRRASPPAATDHSPAAPRPGATDRAPAGRVNGQGHSQGHSQGHGQDVPERRRSQAGLMPAPPFSDRLNTSDAFDG